MKKKIIFAIKKLTKRYYTNKAKRIVVSYGHPFNVNGHSRFSSSTTVGNNTHFNGVEISDGGSVVIGDNFHSGPGCMMIAQNHNIHGEALPYDDTYVCKDIIIGDNVWLGSRVIILGGVTIGEGAVIQAGSVVVKDIPPLSIAGGHPAVVFSKRDEKHYRYHKRQQNFH